MEFRQLRYFLELVATKSYTKASKNLYITQPTLTWTIKKIEKEMGEDLFYYKNKQLELTKVGEVVYHKSLQIMELFQQMFEEIDETRSALNDRLRIGIKLVVSQLLYEIIDEFKRRYPNIGIEIVQEGTQKTHKMLLNDELDLAFISHPFSLEGLTYRDLHHIDFEVAVFLNQSHSLAGNDKISFNMLKNEQFNLLSEDYAINHWVKKRCRENGFSAAIAMENSNWEILTNQLGRNILILPTFYGQFMNENIVQVPLDDEGAIFRVKLVSKKNTLCTLAMQRFIDVATKYE